MFWLQILNKECINMEKISAKHERTYYHRYGESELILYTYTLNTIYVYISTIGNYVLSPDYESVSLWIEKMNLLPANENLIIFHEQENDRWRGSRNQVAYCRLKNSLKGV